CGRPPPRARVRIGELSLLLRSAPSQCGHAIEGDLAGGRHAQTLARIREGPLMAAGLPGTGVGGLFLILSALLTPLVELRRTVRGRTGPADWRLVGRHATLALGMVTVLGGAIGAVHWALLRSSPTPSGVPARSAGPSLDVGRMAFPVAPALITLAVLGAI